MISLAIATLLFSSKALNAHHNQGVVKVFILAGQSNMVGFGEIHAMDKDGNGMPGTLTWMLSAPDKAPLVRAWQDKRTVPTPKSITIDAKNASFGDPAPGVPKKLSVTFTANSRRETKVIDENGTLSIPGSSSSIVVEQAFYGDLPNGQKFDVTAGVRKLVASNTNRTRWITRNDVWVWFNDRKGGLTPGFGSGPDHFGAELGFGQVMGDSTADPVLIIKTAWGGKSLFEDFRPPSSGGKVGPFYKQMIDTIQQSMKDIPKEFPALANRRAELAGLLWWQGWNDAYPKGAVPEYEQNLVNLIGDVRKDLGAPSLPIVVAELTGPWVKADAPWDKIREAQNAACDLIKHPQKGGNVAFVSTRSFVRAEKDSPGGWAAHEFNNAETYYLVGKASGDAMAKLLSRQK